MQRNADERNASYDVFFVYTPLWPKSILHSTFLYLENKLYSTLSVDFKSQFTISRKKTRENKLVTSLAPNVFQKKNAHPLLLSLAHINTHER